MTRTWLSPSPEDLQHERPSLRQLIDSWPDLRWERRPLEEPEVLTFIDAVNRTHVNGGCLASRWRAVEYSEVTEWFIRRGFFGDYELLRTLFDSPAFREGVPELQVPDRLDRSPGGMVPDTASPYWLDGEWAFLLVTGGAYEAFRGTAKEAKALAGAASDALMQGRYEEFAVASSDSPWTPWFFDVAWDHTWALVDRRQAEVTLFCITDTD